MGRLAREERPAPASSLIRHASAPVPLVPVEQLTDRSGVEKWKPDDSCIGESGVTAPW